MQRLLNRKEERQMRDFCPLTGDESQVLKMIYLLNDKEVAYHGDGFYYVKGKIITDKVALYRSSEGI